MSSSPSLTSFNVANPGGDGEQELEITAQVAAAFRDSLFVPSWVDWPLTGPDDARGRSGSRTYDPDGGVFWTKVASSPHLWVQETGGAPAPTGDLTWSDGTGAQWEDGTPIELPDE